MYPNFTNSSNTRCDASSLRVQPGRLRCRDYPVSQKLYKKIKKRNIHRYPAPLFSKQNKKYCTTVLQLIIIIRLKCIIIWENIHVLDFVLTWTPSEQWNNHPRSQLARQSQPAMSATVSNIVFDDIFTILDINKEGKKFDRGPRDLTSFLPWTITSHRHY